MQRLPVYRHYNYDVKKSDPVRVKPSTNNCSILFFPPVTVMERKGNKTRDVAQKLEFSNPKTLSSIPWRCRVGDSFSILPSLPPPPLAPHHFVCTARTQHLCAR